MQKKCVTRYLSFLAPSWKKCIEISRAVRSSGLECILDIFEPQKNSKRGIRIFEMAELRTLTRAPKAKKEEGERKISAPESDMLCQKASGRKKKLRSTLVLPPGGIGRPSVRLLGNVRREREVPFSPLPEWHLYSSYNGRIQKFVRKYASNLTLPRNTLKYFIQRWRFQQ